MPDKTQTTKRFACASGAASIPSVLAWFAGYNFDHRGQAAFVVVGMTLWAFCSIWFCPNWGQYDR